MKIFMEHTKTGRKRFKIMLYLGSGILLASILFASFTVVAKAKISKQTSYKYYHSIQLQPGDTLWEIADKYMTAEYGDRDDYIEEICILNHITEDDIHAGQYLVIPYYSQEYLE